jgi:glycosyltransferase involved in cell wall biosynthesis
MSFDGIRVHLVGPFNTPTTMGDEGIANAFASKVVRMAKILKKLGFYVIFYGVEGSDVICDEFVQVSTKDILEKAYGKWNKETVYKLNCGDIAFNEFNKNTINEINKRKRGGDLLLLCLGTFQKPIADAVNIPYTIEIGIGYLGSFARFRIFESYYIMNYTYGMEGIKDIDFYNTVIPGFFDPNDFEYSEKKDDYFLYLGRIISRKGIFIAQQVCQKINAKLIAAGFGYSEEDNQADAISFREFIKMPNVEYIGFAGLEKRKKLLSKAKAVFMPTIYLEPFGYVAIEAMFSGTPVITTDGGAFPETVHHGKTGYRCYTFEQFVWAAKNIHKIKPSDCRKWAMHNFSMEKATEMYREYFERILNLSKDGWYQENTNRKNLKFLEKKY